jgi:hypothetical protein
MGGKKARLALLFLYAVLNIENAFLDTWNLPGRHSGTVTVYDVSF